MTVQSTNPFLHFLAPGEWQILKARVGGAQRLGHNYLRSQAVIVSEWGRGRGEASPQTLITM